MCSIIGFLGTSISKEKLKEFFDRTISRGPDMQRFSEVDGGILGFERLSIMGLSEAGMQPFVLGANQVVCNGEIYGFRKLKEELSKDYTFVSESDCEILLPMYEKYGTDMFGMLDAEYACIIYDAKRKSLVAARDPIGIRPLFYGYPQDGEIIFASEAKNLVGLCDKIMPFPPGHYYADGQFVCYRDMTEVKSVVTDDVEEICKNIHDKLVAGIEKRLDADAPLGFLLSGGLDSSLVCAVSQKLLNKPIKTFAIGMSTDAIDLKRSQITLEVIIQK